MHSAECFLGCDEKIRSLFFILSPCIFDAVNTKTWWFAVFGPPCRLHAVQVRSYFPDLKTTAQRLIRTSISARTEFTRWTEDHFAIFECCRWRSGRTVALCRSTAEHWSHSAASCKSSQWGYRTGHSFYLSNDLVRRRRRGRGRGRGRGRRRFRIDRGGPFA